MFTSIFAQFQFHKGTIRTKIMNSICSVAFEFQFHKGTIRTCYSVPADSLLVHFNSIKVQLELDYFTSVLPRAQ